MSIWGKEAEHRWPTGVIWFASYLIFLGTSYGTKKTYRSSINSLNTIWALLNIPSPLGKKRCYPKRQVDVFLALATMASSKAASTCRVAKCAAEDEWLLNGNEGPIIDSTLWKRMYRRIQVYKGRSFADKSAVLPCAQEGWIHGVQKGTHHGHWRFYHLGRTLWGLAWITALRISCFIWEQAQSNDIIVLQEFGRIELGLK